MQDLKILCLQADIVPDNPEQNRELLGIKIRNHAEQHDLIVLPEALPLVSMWIRPAMQKKLTEKH